MSFNHKKPLSGQNMSCTSSKKKIKHFSYSINDKIGKGFSSIVYKGCNELTSNDSSKFRLDCSSQSYRYERCQGFDKQGNARLLNRSTYHIESYQYSKVLWCRQGAILLFHYYWVLQSGRSQRNCKKETQTHWIVNPSYSQRYCPRFCRNGLKKIPSSWPKTCKYFHELRKRYNCRFWFCKKKFVNL